MNYVMIILLGLLMGCSAMPELFKTVDDIATDDAITVKVDRDALQKDTDVDITVNVRNKDQKQKEPKIND